MIKFILLAIVIVGTIWVAVKGKAKKWPTITIASLLVADLILYIYKDNSNFIHQITDPQFVLMLLILWILSIAPHVDSINEESKKSSTTTDQKDKA